MNDSDQQAKQSFGRDHLQNDPYTLGVAETLVNTAKIQNNCNLIKPNKDPVYDQQNETIECHESSMRYLNNDDLVSFPLKLMKILSNHNHNDIIRWLEHGRGFMIFQTKEFVAKVMPKYFRQTKYTSFTRKLGRWGFLKIQRGQEIGVFHHALFLRDQPHLCLQIRIVGNREGNITKNDKLGQTQLSEKREQTTHRISQNTINASLQVTKCACHKKSKKQYENHAVSLQNSFTGTLQDPVAQYDLLSAHSSDMVFKDPGANNAKAGLRSMLSNSCCHSLLNSEQKRRNPLYPKSESLQKSHTAFQILEPSIINLSEDVCNGIPLQVHNESSGLMLNHFCSQRLLNTPKILCRSKNIDLPDDLKAALLRPTFCVGIGNQDTIALSTLRQSFPNIPLWKVRLAQDDLIKSALKKIGRDLGVVL